MKKLIFNPFNRIAGIKALLVGLSVILLTAVICFFGHTHFDGALDSHFGSHSNFLQYLKEGIVDVASIIIIFYLLGLILAGTRFRFIDIAGTMAFARIPLIITSLFVLILPHERFVSYILYTFLRRGTPVTIGFGDITGFVILSFITIVIVVWMIALMWNAFRVCMNSKKPKVIVTFIIGLLLAEVLSKVILIFWNC